VKTQPAPGARWAAALALVLGCGDDGGVRPDAALDDAPVMTTEVPVEGHTTDGSSIGCKITVEGLDGTPSPRWGTSDSGHVGVWLDADNLAVDDTVLARACSARLPLPPGHYRLTLSRGPEWNAPVQTLDLGATPPTPLAVEMTRAVDSTGWACADLHVHSAPSYDSDVPLEQRLLSALVEGLDLMVPADHDALGAWEDPASMQDPEGDVLLVLGDELTPDQWPGSAPLGHVNLYPVPETLDTSLLVISGATVEELLDAARVAAPGALAQINHPRWNGSIGYFASIGFDPATVLGRDGRMIAMFDAVEVWNGHEQDRVEGTTLDQVLGDWFALLNAGQILVATGSSDTHRLARSPVGSPRTCVRVTDDRPGHLDAAAFVDALASGSAFVTSGPFLEIEIAGAGPGDLVRSTGEVEVRAHVQAADWVGAARFGLVVDGLMTAMVAVGPVPASPAITVPIDGDAWILGLVEDDAPLGVPAGNPTRPMRSLAFTNPVFVDADGDGLWTPPAPMP